MRMLKTVDQDGRIEVTKAEAKMWIRKLGYRSTKKRIIFKVFKNLMKDAIKNLIAQEEALQAISDLGQEQSAGEPAGYNPLITDANKEVLLTANPEE